MDWVFLLLFSVLGGFFSLENEIFFLMFLGVCTNRQADFLKRCTVASI